MARQQHQLRGLKFEQAPGVGDRQRSLACCSPWCRKESDTTEQLNHSNTRLSRASEAPKGPGGGLFSDLDVATQ